MKPNFAQRAWPIACALMLLLLVCAAPAARAQEEGVPQVVDEVVAQVNGEVLTLSMVKNALREAAESLQQTRGLTPEQAQAETEKRKPEIIAALINEQLLLQRGKELGLSEEVEAEVNRRMLAVGNDQGIKSLDALYAEMRKAGLSPDSVRQTIRSEAMKTFVLGQEVDRKIFLGLTESEVKTYYEAHKDKFRKPETVALSEIYFSSTGKPEAEVKAHADKLVAQLRAPGANFAATAKVESERVDEKGVRIAPTTGGKLDTYAVNDITRPELAAALKNLKSGGVSDPVRTDAGYLILRVDARTPAGEPTFTENQVREAITLERLDKERKNYLANLRREAYLDINPAYKEAVSPLLASEADTRAKTAAVAAPAVNKKDNKKANSKKP